VKLGRWGRCCTSYNFVKKYNKQILKLTIEKNVCMSSSNTLVCLYHLGMPDMS